jgi:hypothetical protein
MVKWLRDTAKAAQWNCANLEYWSDGVMGNKTDTPPLQYFRKSVT